MPGIIETLGAMAGTDLGKAINLAHTTFQDRMGEHNHFGRALLETIAKVAREHPNLMGIGAALLVEAIILADKRHHELHPAGAAQPHAGGGGPSPRCEGSATRWDPRRGGGVEVLSSSPPPCSFFPSFSSSPSSSPFPPSGVATHEG